MLALPYCGLYVCFLPALSSQSCPSLENNLSSLTLPPYSGVAHAITLSPMPALLSFLHSPVLLTPGLFLWRVPFHPPTHSSKIGLCFSSSKKTFISAGATPCSSVYESLPLLNTIHLDTSSFTTLHS